MQKETVDRETREAPSHDGLGTAVAAWRRSVYEVIEADATPDRRGRLFDAFIVTLILLNVAAFVAETEPSLAHAYGRWFDAFEAISVAIFTFEYLLRLWTAVEVPFLSRLPPWRARLALARRGPMIIDLLAILPFYLGHYLGADLRVLRVLRLLRFLKLTRYSPAIHSLIRVVTSERRALQAAALLLAGAVLFAATGIYFLENEAQPDKFESVPQSAWWAIATLTTVGYGDVTPITPLGRLFGGLVMVTGLCILALPVAIISAGFAQEVSRRDFVVNWSMMSRIPMLAELDAKEVAHIMPLLHAHNLPPNVEVLAAGSEAKAMYFVASGKVRYHDGADEALASEFGTGDVFGVVAMLENDVNQGSFITATKCRLLKLHKEDFHRLETANPAITQRLRRIAMARRSSAGSTSK